MSVSLLRAAVRSASRNHLLPSSANSSYNPDRSPNININRDPRWGRNQEVPSEDPLVNGNYGAQHTMGLQQGEDPRHVKVAVTVSPAER